MLHRPHRLTATAGPAGAAAVGPSDRVPLVIAHRGASAALPEHTLPAYQRALAEGADGLECDVRLTRDGELVCLHDRRLERTSDGRGLVADHTLEQLRRLDFGSWHGTGPAGVLTLEELLTEVRRAGRPVRLMIETKHPARHGPLVERRLIALLHRHGLAAPAPDDPVRVTVLSFSVIALRRVRALAPGLPTGFLLQVLPPGYPRRRPPFGFGIAGPSIGLARSRPWLVPALRAAGAQVYVWTVNHPDDLALVARQQVTGVITDRPGYARAVLSRS